MARYYGEYEDASISQELEPNIARNTGDFEVSGDAGHDGYTVLNRRLRSSTAGDWPENDADAKRLEDMRASFGISDMLSPFTY